MRAVVVFALLAATGRAAADDAGWIRVTAGGKAVLFRPDGTERTEVAASAGRGQPSPDGGPIVIMDSAGKVSPAGVPEGQTAYSPDGRRFAWVARRGDHWQVHVSDRAGGVIRQLTDAPHGAWQPKFGPDGRLAYLVYRERTSKLQPADLVIAGDKETTAVVKNVFVTDYAWSPDGKAIAYGKPGALVFHDLTTGQAREVAFSNVHKDLRSHGAWGICWAPDGRAVACTITFLGGRMAGGPPIFGDDEVFVVRRDGRTTWFRHGGGYPQLEWVKAK